MDSISCTTKLKIKKKEADSMRESPEKQMQWDELKMWLLSCLAFPLLALFVSYVIRASLTLNASDEVYENPFGIIGRELLGIASSYELTFISIMLWASVKIISRSKAKNTSREQSSNLGQQFIVALIAVLYMILLVFTYIEIVDTALIAVKSVNVFILVLVIVFGIGKILFSKQQEREGRL